MISRSLDKARDAYKKDDPDASKAAHSTISEDHKNNQGQYIKSLIYGGLDGVITTFAVVAGVAGAALEARVVLILGFANLVADGLSMAIGDFLSTKAENEYFQAEKQRELWEVQHFIDGEKKEMVELYTDKGITIEDANIIVNTLSKYKEAFVDVMMAEELGMVEDSESPFKNALVTFVSFLTFGFVPLSIYIITQFTSKTLGNFEIAIIFTAITLFILGALKTRFSNVSWIRGGFEMLLVGGIAAFAAYGIGVLFA